MVILRNMKYVIISTTIDTAVKADKLADLIIKNRLAACAQIMPIKSIYRWKGKVERAREFLLFLKTKTSLKSRLIKFIRRSHPYEVPEIAVLNIVDGLNDYLKWIDMETGNK